MIAASAQNSNPTATARPSAQPGSNQPLLHFWQGNFSRYEDGKWLPMNDVFHDFGHDLTVELVGHASQGRVLVIQPSGVRSERTLRHGQQLIIRDGQLNVQDPKPAPALS